MDNWLPFWHFFVDIEKMLSYERWIDKYKLMLQAISTGQVQFDSDWSGFRRFLKILYLQDIRDEVMFDRLFDKAIVQEQALLELYFNRANARPAADVPDEVPPPKTDVPPPTRPPEVIKPAASGPAEVKKTGMDEPLETAGDRKKYYHPPPVPVLQDIPLTANAPAGQDGFLQTDEYFPVTRRQMIKAWQYLRHKEKGSGSEGLDIRETTLQIARDGLFLEPRYQLKTRNRVDTVIILADCRGSMIPFHELTNRMIATARGEGGHPKAPVFYFQNFPMGYVYRHPSLAQPVKLKEALLTANKSFTLAIVISDCGAARGSAEFIPSRVKATEPFLETLRETCAHTIWFNPMPVHRWRNTAAEQVRRKVLLMAPILENNNGAFQDTLRNIFKHKH